MGSQNNSTIKSNVSSAPVVWFPLLVPYWLLIYAFYFLRVLFRTLVYALVLSVFLAPTVFTIALFAFLLMPVTASQDAFFQSGQTLFDIFTTFYDEFLVEPINQISDCFFLINVWYNQTIAFLQAILARIGQELGVDVFVWALRGEAQDWQLAKVRLAALRKLREQESLKGGFAKSHKNHARLMMRAHRLANRVMDMSSHSRGSAQYSRNGFGSRNPDDGFERRGARQERIPVASIIEFICDFLGFIIGFISALLDLFQDFFLFFLDILLDFIGLIIFDPSALDIITVFVLSILNVLLDLIDPLGCFHPIDELPERIYLCICPHAYPNASDVPTNIFNAMAGCFCPGIDLTSSDILEDILKPCLDVDFLETLLNLISTLIGTAMQTLNSIQQIATQIQNSIGRIQNLKNEIEDLADTIEDIICSIPFVCRRSVIRIDINDINDSSRPAMRFRAFSERHEQLRAMAGMEEFLPSDPKAVEPVVELVEVLDKVTGEVRHTYYRILESKGQKEHFNSLVDKCYYYTNQTSAMLDEGYRRLSALEEVQENMRVQRGIGKETMQLAEQIYAAKRDAQRKKTLMNTIDGFLTTREYLKSVKRSLVGKTLLQLMADRVRDTIVTSDDPVIRNRIKAAERAGRTLGFDDSEDSEFLRRVGKDYAVVFGTFSKLAKMYMDLIVWPETVDRAADSHARGYVAPARLVEMMAERDINLVDMGMAAMRIADEKAQRAFADDSGKAESETPPHHPLARRTLNAIVHRLTSARMYTSTFLNPTSLPDTVEDLLRYRPESADIVESHLEEIENEVFAIEEINRIVDQHRQRTQPELYSYIKGGNFTRSDVQRMWPATRLKDLDERDVLRIRAILRGETNRAKREYIEMSDVWAHGTHMSKMKEAQLGQLGQLGQLKKGGEGGKEESYVDENGNYVITQRAVVIVGATLIGAGVAVCTIQFAAITVTALLPILIGLGLLLAPIFFVAIPIALDAVIAGIGAFFNGGKPQGVDYVTPFIVELAPFVQDSFTQGWDLGDVQDILDFSFDVLLLDVQYIVAGYLRRFLCVFPRIGILDSCPPKPRFDPVTGAPAVTLPEYAFELLSCDPTASCASNMDCVGNADCACIGEPREGTEDAPCTGSGFCRCWPYVNPTWGLQEISGTIDLDPQCASLGWPNDKIATYQTDNYFDLAKQWWENSQRTLRFFTNRLSIGVFLPWIGLFGLWFNLLPIGDTIPSTIFWSTLVFNVVSEATVPLSSSAIDLLESNIGAPLFIGTVSEYLIDFFRFPNFANGDNKGKGSPTTQEWLCVVVQSPPSAAGTLLLFAFTIPILPLLFAGILPFIFYFICDILLLPINYIFLVGRIILAHGWMYRRKAQVYTSVSLYAAGVDARTAAAVANGEIVDLENYRPPKAAKISATLPVGMAYQLGSMANMDARELKRRIPAMRAHAVRGPDPEHNERCLKELDALEHWVNFSIGMHTGSVPLDEAMKNRSLFSAGALVPDMWESVWTDPWFSMRKRKFFIKF